MPSDDHVLPVPTELVDMAPPPSEFGTAPGTSVCEKCFGGSVMPVPCKGYVLSTKWNQHGAGRPEVNHDVFLICSKERLNLKNKTLAVAIAQNTLSG